MTRTRGSTKNVYPDSFVDDMSLLDNPLCVDDSSLLNEKSGLQIDLPVSSDSNNYPKPVIITSLISMENSNNAVDCVPLFRDTRPSETVFKLPISELSFNGTLKHIQKLKPIVDPISALTSGYSDTDSTKKTEDAKTSDSDMKYNSDTEEFIDQESSSHQKLSDATDDTSAEEARDDKTGESTGDSQYSEFSRRNLEGHQVEDAVKGSKWGIEQSLSSLEASFDSGVRSPDIFSDESDPDIATENTFWDFVKEREIDDKIRLSNLEEKLQGVLPPPSVTTVNADVTEILNKYYAFLPIFNGNENVNTDPATPSKKLSVVNVPEDTIDNPVGSNSFLSRDDSKMSTTTVQDRKSAMWTEAQAKETTWPHVLKCKYYDVHYNLTPHSEKLELLGLRYAERCVGAETATSATVSAAGKRSPTSATKRKELRMKLAQGKSPGRRLSHLARRRQTFCSAATINDKINTTASKMVLIDKNFFPHRKLKYNTTDRKSSPRLKIKKTPGKKTPKKTPKTRSGGSSRKKAMRRLMLDQDTGTRTQPTRETLKRALFVSPEAKKPPPTMVLMKSKRALFESPTKDRGSKSLDGTISDNLKRKRDPNDPDGNRNKIAKSFSFGGDSVAGQYCSALQRRSSEMVCYRSPAELNEIHRKKLLWAVNEALRAHGCRMGSAGFRERMSALWRLTQRLLALPEHAAALAAPARSTSDVMLKLARQYSFAIIQGRSEDECYMEEKLKLTKEATGKVTGYISASAYQELKSKQLATKVKENTCTDAPSKLDSQRNGMKNVLQDKLVNIDTSSNSDSSLGPDKSVLFKSNSMPSVSEAAKMRARRQISFDNVDFPKR